MEQSEASEQQYGSASQKPPLSKPGSKGSGSKYVLTPNGNDGQDYKVKSSRRKRHRKSLSVVSVKSDRSYLSKNPTGWNKQETINFLRNMEAKETFQTPHDRGTFLVYFLASSIAVLSKNAGIIGYQEEGLKKYEIQEEEMVKITSLKDSKLN